MFAYCPRVASNGIGMILALKIAELGKSRWKLDGNQSLRGETGLTTGRPREDSPVAEVVVT
jgi:hypothetical protein